MDLLRNRKKKAEIAEKAGLTSGQNIQNFAGAMHGFPVRCADLHRITRGIERNQYTFLDKEVLINK